jgi:hypothetical protein
MPSRHLGLDAMAAARRSARWTVPPHHLGRAADLVLGRRMRELQRLLVDRREADFGCQAKRPPSALGTLNWTVRLVE